MFLLNIVRFSKLFSHFNKQKNEKNKVDLFPVHEKTSYFLKTNGLGYLRRPRGCFLHIPFDMKFLRVTSNSSSSDVVTQPVFPITQLLLRSPFIICHVLRMFPNKKW